MRTATPRTGNCSTTPGPSSRPRSGSTSTGSRAGDEPGRLIGAVTRRYQIPYRPSANYNHCTTANGDAGKWWSSRDDECYNGKSFNVSANLGSLELPEQAIISVEYNTTHNGYEPIGESAPCFSAPGGCGYDSLNVGTFPTVFRWWARSPLPDDAYQNSTWTGAYCDNGAGGTGTFRLDAGCWTGFQPAFTVSATDYPTRDKHARPQGPACRGPRRAAPLYPRPPPWRRRSSP